jgi:chitin disaccharide deacetylase
MKRGVLILNADDWGRDLQNTDSILACFKAGSLSSASAMVFMADSERSASLAAEHGLETGLHLNFTAGFTGTNYPAGLAERQKLLSRYLRGHRLAQIVFHPTLRKHFQYVVEAQLDEFRRLYGQNPERVDGHHHMHLCANVLWQRLLPAGTMVRRNFSFLRGQKSALNVRYRRWVDGLLARRHVLTDFFFSIEPVANIQRLGEVFSLAEKFSVEVETHPVNAEEFSFLAEGGLFRCFPGVAIGRPSTLLKSFPAEKESLIQA